MITDFPAAGRDEGYMGRVNICKFAAFGILLLCCGFVAAGCGNGSDSKGSRTVPDGISAGGETGCIINGLTVNYRENPMGIEETPVFGWKMEDTAKGQRQTAYRIVVGASLQALEDKDYLWDSGRVESDISVAIPYGGGRLRPESRYYWKVYVWEKDGKIAESGGEAWFETGLSQEGWNGAEWICLGDDGVAGSREAKDAAGDTSYRISYDIRLSAAYAGFIWGADAGRYGEYFRWALDTTEENVSLVMSHMAYETVLEEKSISLQSFFPDRDDFCARPHHVRLNVDGKQVDTYVDDILVSQYENTAAKEIGSIGFWVDRGAQYAGFGNIYAEDFDGKVLYEESFAENPQEAGNSAFFPYYLNIRDGWAKVDSGWVMTGGAEKPAPMLRKSFDANEGAGIDEVRLYASALGIYRLFINGEEISGEYFSPGQSLYDTEVYYRTYDVTEYVREGENVIGAVLGHGRYDRAKSDWGDELAFCAKLAIVYEDGSTQEIVTDGSWESCGNGPIRNDDLFSGEYYDADYAQEGWAEPSFAAAGWQSASLYTGVNADAVKRAAMSEPVKCVEEIPPVSVSEPLPGVYVYDFGQNFNGVCRITVEGRKGQAVTLRFAETLNKGNMSCMDDEEGTVWTQNLYTADNIDYYILRGEGRETYTPSFVCRGFRYVQVTGVEEAIPPEDICGLVLSSDNKRTGWFECSDERVNRLYDSICWSQISNFVDIPMDCPQRDERLGWMGDAQVFAKTASYNADIYNFMRKTIDALRERQHENGAYPEIAFGESQEDGRNGWSDAGIILVWEMYQQYGDIGIVEENFDAMCRYMDYLVETSDGYIRHGEWYSDHNAFSGSDADLCNTAQCAYAASLLAKMAEAAGEEEAAEKYAAVHENYRKAWQEKYIREDGSVGNWSQTEYVLGLAFGLYPEELRQKGAEYLLMSVDAGNYHPMTGYITTGFLLPVLCEYGYAEAAYKLLLQTGYPSWLDMLSHGGTTIFEGWSTYYTEEDGLDKVNGSLNHYALGSVGAWMYSDMLGIRRDENNPGFKHFYLEPRTGGGLSYAKGRYESVYGTILSEWRIEGDETVFHFVIPANTTATVFLPGWEEEAELEAGEYEYRVFAGD